jgi:outer membrane protein assembly factor BamA
VLRTSAAAALCLGLLVAQGASAADSPPSGADVVTGAVPAPPESASAANARRHPKQRKPSEPAKPAKRPKPAIVAVPIPLSNPAVGSGATAVAAVLYQPPGAGDVWTTGVGAVYTSTKSYGFGFLQKSDFAQDRFRLTAGAAYGNFNLRFYGIGSTAASNQFININQTGAGGLIEGLMRVAPHTYLGPRYIGLELRTTLPSIEKFGITIPSLQLKSTNSQLGPSFVYDSRNSQYGPSSGIYSTAQWMFSEPEFGSKFQYDKGTVDVNGYFSLGPSTVLAARISACATSKGAPFYDICLYGSRNDLRGYSTGQYRDPRMAAAQVELRQHLFWKFGAVVFGGVGGIEPGANSFGSRFNIGKGVFLPAGGAGLRFMVAPQYKLNMAVDYAVGKNNSNALYVRLGEAF